MTFLFTDIEGSTRLLERLRGRYAELLAEHRRLLRDAFASWHGHEIDTQGDSFFVAFPRASDALHCAIQAQRALAGSEWPDGVEVTVRMGIHTGEPLVAGHGYVGMDVHRAARIAAAGHGGQILVSGTVHDLVADELPSEITLLDLGTHKLKGLRAETHLYQVSSAGLRADFGPPSTAATEDPPPTPGESPYRGLQAFEEHDAALFFGREGVVGELLAMVERVRFVALVGASGSGKSSILRAGLIPTLRERHWRVQLLTPTAHPLEALAAAVLPDSPPSQIAALADDLRRDPRGLAVAMRDVSGRRLIAVDQLEEVFTLCRDEVERQAFLGALIHASGLDEGPAATPPDADRATVAVTLRADFYAFLAPYPVLREATAASQLYVGAMSHDELRRAIEAPARRGGWDFTPGLVDLLLRDVGDEPGALPLLSHALLETWRRRRGTVMTLRSYSEAGGVNGAIARTADRIYDAELNDAQRRIARNVFLRLTELGEGTQDTRRRARLGELMPGDARHSDSVRQVIGVLAAARLITVGEDSAEVAHEALIREWPRLRDWLAADRDSLRQHRRLADAAAEWAASGLDESLLFRGARLAQAREATAYKGILSEAEQRFLDASMGLEQREESERDAARQREVEAAQALAAAEGKRAEESSRAAASLKRRALMLVGALAVAVVLAGIAATLARQSGDNAARADLAAQQAQANASLAAQHEAEARDNATLAEQRAREAQDSQALAQQRAVEALAERLGAESSDVLSRGDDPQLAAMLALASLQGSYTPQADLTLQRAARRGFAEALPGSQGIGTIAVTPDGRTMITCCAANKVELWDLASRTVVTTVDAILSASGVAPLFQLSDDGTLLLVYGYHGQGALYLLTGTGAQIEAQRISESCEPLQSRLGIATISGDGTRLAVAREATSVAGSVNSDIVVVELPSCREVTRILQGDVEGPVLNVDGTLLSAALEGSSQVRLWNAQTGEVLATFGQDLGPYWNIAFAHDSSRLVTAGVDGTARIFTLDGQLDKTFRGHGDLVSSAFLSKDNGILVTTSWDNTARAWDAATQVQIARFNHVGGVNWAALSDDGRYLYTASEDGALVWPTDPGAESFSYSAGDLEVAGLAFAPDGGSLAAATGDVVTLTPTDGDVGAPFATLRNVKLVTFSTDGAQLLISTAYGTSLWDVANAREDRLFGTGFDPGNSLAASLSSDGSLALGVNSISGGGVVFLWQTADGKPYGSTAGVFQFQTAALSADGTKIVGWFPGRYDVFDTANGEPLLGIALGESVGRPVDLAFVPDASRFVSGDHDNVVRVRDANTGEVLHEMPGHSGAIRQVRVSRDGHFALTASDDGTARLWDLDNGTLTRIFAGHQGRAVTAVAFAPDGRSVALGSSDGTVIIAPVLLDTLVDDICARLSRDLTDSERSAFGVDAATTICP